jgi:large subunit ribosomal protein L6e
MLQKIQSKWRFASKGDTRTEEQKTQANAKKTAAQALRNNILVKSKYYTADATIRPLKSRKSHHKPCKLRSSITPGTVVILLAGRFRGKRVICLKQLKESGLLLVSGPFKINGVPLRRVNQAYVIATTTKVDVASIDVSKITDEYFAKDSKTETRKKQKQAKGILSFEGEKTELPAAKKAEQKRVDTALLAAVKKVPTLSHYLNAKFTLTNGQKPHALKF